MSEDKRKQRTSTEKSRGKKNSVNAKRKRSSSNPFNTKARKEQSKKMTKQLIISIVVLVALVGAMAVYVFVKDNDHMVAQGEEVYVSFPYGFLSSEYADTLVEKGMVNHAQDFNSVVSSKNCANDLKPGVYKMVGGESVDEIVNQLVAGPNSTFTINEGDSLQTIADNIATSYGSMVKADKMMEKFTNLGEYYPKYAFLQGHDTMEGFLTPGTYQTQVFATMEFDTSRANKITEQILNVYAEQHGYPTVDYTLE